MAVTVRLNSSGVGQLLKSSAVRADLTARADRVLSAAQSSAPVDTGAYKASLHLEDDTTDRAVVRVVSDVAYAMVIQAKTGNLARALDSAR